MLCEQCIRESRKKRRLTLHLKNPIEHITTPGDAMPIDLLSELLPSGGFENIVTAMVVISCFTFLYLSSNQDAKTIDRVIIIIMTNHENLPTKIISLK